MAQQVLGDALFNPEECTDWRTRAKMEKYGAVYRPPLGLRNLSYAVLHAGAGVRSAMRRRRSCDAGTADGRKNHRIELSP